MHVALVVAQSRDRHGRVTAIDLPALDEGLRRVAAFAVAAHASLHLARIGHATPHFNWYGTERLLRKRLCQRGVPATVYYFRRHAQSARPARRLSDAPPSQPSQPSQPVADDSTSLPDVFSGATVLGRPHLTLHAGDVVHLHGLGDVEAQRLRRLIIAFDGDVCARITAATTHVVTPPGFDLQTSPELAAQQQQLGFQLVDVAWVDGKAQQAL